MTELELRMEISPLTEIITRLEAELAEIKSDMRDLQWERDELYWANEYEPLNPDTEA